MPFVTLDEHRGLHEATSSSGKPLRSGVRVAKRIRGLMAPKFSSLYPGEKNRQIDGLLMLGS
jgi:hypothetical protein